jgi:hypothetical protein
MAGLNLFTNNAATTLATGINSSVTSLTVASATGGLFPNPTAGQYFYCTLSNAAGTTIEIVKVTARSTDTFTIVRGQDNTTAAAFIAGDKVELRLTAADLQNFPQLDSTNTFALAQTFTSGVVLTVDLPVTDGGTGASDATTARTNLSAAKSGANSDITSITGLTTPLTTAQGGTGAASLAAATIATLGYTTTATAAGTTTLTASSTATQFFTGTTTQTVVLPVTSTLTQGQQFTIHNNSTGAITINSSGSNLVATADANTTTILTCILTSGTTAASWDADLTGFTTSLPVSRGGTGATSATAYAVQCGGTTSTGAHQSIASVGTSGQVLTSNGAGALPTFQTAASGGGQYKYALFASSSTWTCPAGVTSVKIYAVGGGGGGSTNQGQGGRGGRGVVFATVTPGTVYTVTVGTGGASVNGLSGSGGTTSVGSLITATGGGGGNNNCCGIDGASGTVSPATFGAYSNDYFNYYFTGALVKSAGGVAVWSSSSAYVPGPTTSPGYGGVGGVVLIEYIG